MSKLDQEIHRYFQSRVIESHPCVIRVNRYSIGPNTFGIDCWNAHNEHKGMQFARGFWDVMSQAKAEAANNYAAVSERDRLYILADLIYAEIHEHLTREGW